MHNLFLLLFHFIKPRKWGLFGISAGVMAVLIYFSLQLKTEEDITKFLPKTAGISKINKAMESLKIKDRMVLMLQNQQPANLQAMDMENLADFVSDTLRSALDSTMLLDVRYKQSEDKFPEIYDVFNRNIAVFLDQKDYTKIEARLHPDSIEQIMAANYKSLLSPVGIVTNQFIQTDPLGLTPIAIKRLQRLQFDENIELRDGYLFSKNGKTLLLFITPAFKSNDNTRNKILIEFIDKIAAIVKIKSKGAAELQYYGASAVSLSNGSRIKTDTTITTLLAIAAILFILIWYFKSIKAAIILVLPVLFGASFSLALVFFIKGSVSIIAIGAGSVVLGIAINYSLHILTHYKHFGKPEIVLQDLTNPMILGCVTTVAAFFCLVFVKSEALHDFGLFAGFSLIGAMLFSLIVMPHLLGFIKPGEEKHSSFDKVANMQPHKNKYIVLFTVISTICLAYFSTSVGFETDMQKLNYENPALSKWHQNLDSINHFSNRSVFISVHGKTLQEALVRNEQVDSSLKVFEKHKKITTYAGLGGIILSEKEQLKRQQTWNLFWGNGKWEKTKNNILTAAAKYGFAGDAFQAFFDIMDKQKDLLNNSDMNLLRDVAAKDMISQNADGISIATLVKSDDINKHLIYNSWQYSDYVTVFDRASLATLFTNTVISDFQTILLFTAIMVFVVMLLSHGRLELTIINFLPMFISWLCILGIMSIFGITFNVINIIISTFVFGLGDDYSIFILDGLSGEYRTGKKVLNSYKSAILLSAVTTIIGLGVLVFTKHPALRSIASIAVVGLVIVVFVSFVIQPLIYNALILSRTKRGLPPYTLVNLCITFFGFLAFTLGSIVLTILGFLLIYVIPISRKKRKLYFHYALMYTNRAILKCFVNVRKSIINPENEKFEKPAIIIANHQSHIDLALIMQLHPKIIFFTNDWVWKSPFYGQIVRMADYFPASKGFENAEGELRNLVADGYSIMIFPEGTRSVDGEIHRLHKGAFLLQQQLGLDILPILIHGAGDCVTKGDFHFKKGRLVVQILPRIAAADTTFGTDYQSRTKSITKYLRSTFTALRLAQENGSYFRSKLISNYIFKGPILEWYTRIKTRFENNYSYFEKLIPKNAVVTDIGCGYGYLSFMLAFTGKDRQILGIDYDSEKIELASNNFAKQKYNLRFENADCTQYNYPSSDAIFILDVLHYLPQQSQEKLLLDAMAKLNPNGVLVLRDSDKKMQRKHSFTKYTEFFSTNTGFNKKTKDGLHFVSSDWIKAIAEKANMQVEIIDKTKWLANLVYIIKHKKTEHV